MRRLTVGVDLQTGLDSEALAVVLRSHLANSGFDVDVVALDVARADTQAWATSRVSTGVGAVFVIADDGAGGLALQLTLPNDGGTWTRVLPAGAGQEARLESIGVMIRAMATSMDRPLAASPAVTRPAPPKPVAPQPAPATSSKPAPPQLDIALGYAGTTISSQAPWHSAASLRAHLVARQPWTALLGISWFPPQAAGPIRLARVAVDIGLGGMFLPGARARPVAAGGATIEAFGWSFGGASRGWGVRVAAHALGGVDVALTPRIGLLATARVDAWIRNARVVEAPASGRIRGLFYGHVAAFSGFAGMRVRLGGSFVHPPATRVRHRSG